jgi:hypothetical protein
MLLQQLQLLHQHQLLKQVKKVSEIVSEIIKKRYNTLITVIAASVAAAAAAAVVNSSSNCCSSIM